MTPVIIKKYLPTLGAFLLHALSLPAQPESESPYSDQAFDPIDNPAWYESIYLWVGLVIGLFILFLLLRRGGKRSRKFMGREE